MQPTLYVATDAGGIQHLVEHDRRWTLPRYEDGAWRTGDPTFAAPGEHALVLADAEALLETLGERIFSAVPEPLDDGTVARPDDRVESPASGELAGEHGTVLEVVAARLVAETNWDATIAARFALDCAEHVLGDAAGVTLPDGPSLGELVAEARRYLERSNGIDERRLGFFSRLAAARRMRREYDRLGDLAFATTDDDLRAGLDALDDPAWATVAALGDAVLAGVEVLRHVALPRYTAAREATYEREDSAKALPAPQVISTPWGGAMLGGVASTDYVPVHVSAREAAERARLAATDRGGPEAELAERRWQAERLERHLGGAPH